MKRSRSQSSKTRLAIADSAARIMIEGGMRDFKLAKRKALARLGLDQTVPLPSNHEIEQAVLAYQNLFHADDHARRLNALRLIALRAMKFLAPFHPRLVGPVLSGTASRNETITLHVFAEPLERVNLFLADNQVPFDAMERRMRMNRSTYALVPGHRFSAEGAVIEILLFPLNARRQSPLSTTDGRPQARASVAEVERLCAQHGRQSGFG